MSDPRDDLLISIILAQLISAIFVRPLELRFLILVPLVWLLASIAMHFCRLSQPEDKLPYDLLTLEVFHLLIGALVRRNLRLTLGQAFLAAQIGGLIALGVSWTVFLLANFFEYRAEFWSFMTARGAFPYFFWSSLFVASHLAASRTQVPQALVTTVDGR